MAPSIYLFRVVSLNTIKIFARTKLPHPTYLSITMIRRFLFKQAGKLEIYQPLPMYRIATVTRAAQCSGLIFKSHPKYYSSIHEPSAANDGKMGAASGTSDESTSRGKEEAPNQNLDAKNKEILDLKVKPFQSFLECTTSVGFLAIPMHTEAKRLAGQIPTLCRGFSQPSRPHDPGHCYGTQFCY